MPAPVGESYILYILPSYDYRLKSHILRVEVFLILYIFDPKGTDACKLALESFGDFGWAGR